MPDHPRYIQRKIILSGDYQENKAVVKFYTNSAIRIERGDDSVWLDNLEKGELRDALNDQLQVKP